MPPPVAPLPHARPASAVAQREPNAPPAPPAERELTAAERLALKRRNRR
jgi:hypothetical protein